MKYFDFCRNVQKQWGSGLSEFSEYIRNSPTIQPKTGKEFNNFFLLVGLIAFMEGGRQIFRLGAGLAKEFANSKLPKIPVSSLIIPFPYFLVEIPCDLGCFFDNGGFEDVDVRGKIYQRPDPTPYSLTGVLVQDSQHPDSNYTLKLNETENYRVLTFTGCSIHPTDEGKDERTSMLRISPEIEDLESYFIEMAIPKHVRQYTRIAINAILYLNSQDRERELTEAPDKRRIKQLEEKIKTTRKSRVTILKDLEAKLEKEKGKPTITYLAPSLEKVIEREEQTNQATATTARRRHLVRAFWNYYWCKDKEGDGKHLEARRIASYWRGDSAVEVIRKRYKLSEGEK